MSTRKSSRNCQRSPATKVRDQESPLCATLFKGADLGIATLVFVSPHLFGGRHPLGHFVIVALCVATAIMWFAHQALAPRAQWTRFSAWVVPLLAVLWLIFQLVPFPANWLAVLAPRLGELLPLWFEPSSPGPHLGVWKTLSVAPEETRLALASLIAYGLLFVTVVQRLTSVEAIARLMKAIGLSAVVVAIFGIVQYLTSNGHFFWFYEHPFSETTSALKAGFTNRNHFAHYLALGLAMLLSWVMLESRRDHDEANRTRAHGFSKPSNVPEAKTARCFWPLVILLLLVSCTILATLSRGGILAMATVLIVATALYARARLLTANHWMFGGLLVVAAMASLSFSGQYDDVTTRMNAMVSQDIQQIDSIVGRQTIWKANLDSIQAAWLTGSGAGTHRFIYPAYLTQPANLEYTHSENGYLQIATENGLPGILLLVATILACCYWSWVVLHHSRANQQTIVLTVGITSALAASVVHSCVDFVWFIPACTCTTLMLIAALLRMHQLSRLPMARHDTRHATLPRLGRFNVALGVALAGVWSLMTWVAPATTSLEWDSYLRAAQAHHPAQYERAENLSLEELNTSAMLKHLTNFVQRYPHSTEAHSRLAKALVGRFEVLQLTAENPLPLGQIREAVQASNFQSATQLHDWLLHALGKHVRLLYQANFHAHRAIALCPLEGDAYLCLAELCFLEKPAPEGYRSYAQQGLRVSPCDTDLLFALGKYELIAGNEAEALRHWSKAFRGMGNHRNYIIQLSTKWMSASSFLETYQPAWDTLDSIWDAYRHSSDEANLQAIMAYANNLMQNTQPDLSPLLASGKWLTLAKMQSELSGPQAALPSLQQAYLLSPERFTVRYELGKCLLAQKAFAEAESHLKWCQQQFPDNPTIRRDLQNATRGSLQELARSTKTNLY